MLNWKSPKLFWVRLVVTIICVIIIFPTSARTQIVLPIEDVKDGDEIPLMTLYGGAAAQLLKAEDEGDVDNAASGGIVVKIQPKSLSPYRQKEKKDKHDIDAYMVISINKGAELKSTSFSEFKPGQLVFPEASELPVMLGFDVAFHQFLGMPDNSFGVFAEFSYLMANIEFEDTTLVDDTNKISKEGVEIVSFGIAPRLCLKGSEGKQQFTLSFPLSFMNITSESSENFQKIVGDKDAPGHYYGYGMKGIIQLNDAFIEVAVKRIKGNDNRGLSGTYFKVTTGVMAKVL